VSLAWLWLIPLAFVAPWLAATAWVWTRLPRDGFVPPSMGEVLRRRMSTR
jgi:hypothetical protein